jgi:DNA-directed RNA polymerase specialized sigma24 family protein
VPQTLIAKERLAIVATALAVLGERTFPVFKRYRVDGEGQRDIANEHGTSLSAVEKHLQKADQIILRFRYTMDVHLEQPRHAHCEVRNRRIDA